MAQTINKKRHVFTVNPNDNGGEQIHIVTDYVHDGYTGWLEQSIELGSYKNTASLTITGDVLTPKMLRQLANELDEFLIKCEMERSK